MRLNTRNGVPVDVLCAEPGDCTSEVVSGVFLHKYGDQEIAFFEEVRRLGRESQRSHEHSNQGAYSDVFRGCGVPARESLDREVECVLLVAGLEGCSAVREVDRDS